MEFAPDWPLLSGSLDLLGQKVDAPGVWLDVAKDNAP